MTAAGECCLKTGRVEAGDGGRGPVASGTSLCLVPSWPWPGNT